jgi:putative acetyltransferase
MDFSLIETDSLNPDFIKLTKLLDEDLESRYGGIQKQYDRLNSLEHINDVIVAYGQGVPVACGAFKEYDSGSVELKRIFVIKENRRQGLAKLILGKLEEAAKKKGYKTAVLETGVKQREAVSLYENHGYTVIENYGSYAGNDNSVCMKKAL